MTPYEKISRILRTDKDVIRIIDEWMFEILGQRGVLEKIIDENTNRIYEVFKSLGIINATSREIYTGLVERLREDDVRLSKMIHNESGDSAAGFQNMLNVANELANVGSGKFLKLEKAKELILANPPIKIMDFLGYKSSQELLEKEDLCEIFAGLRFVENAGWLNNIFFKPYKNLTPDDFEERPIEAKVLSAKWVRAAEQFLKKKYHNLSHLKELGFIFVLPVSIDVAGATMRDFSLSLHYFHEIKFYSELVKKYMPDKDFAEKFVGLLRGDVVDTRPPDSDLGRVWLIVQRYLAKDDEFDWRLFYPHVNPEALHWQKAEEDISRLSKRFNLGFEFWDGLGPIGDFYKDESGVEVLVSFNLIDTAMSLFQEEEMVKYLYHHQEALWNRIFREFAGEERMNFLIKEKFDTGIIEL